LYVKVTSNRTATRQILAEARWRGKEIYLLLLTRCEWLFTIWTIGAYYATCHGKPHDATSSPVSILIYAEAIWSTALYIIKGTIWFASWNIPAHGWIPPVLLVLPLA